MSVISVDVQTGVTTTRELTAVEIALIQASIPPWSPNELLAEIRTQREMVLNRICGIGFAAQASGDSTTVAAVLACRTALLALTTLPQVLAASNDTQLKVALYGGLLAIKAQAPASLQAAFNGVDQ